MADQKLPALPSRGTAEPISVRDIGVLIAIGDLLNHRVVRWFVSSTLIREDLPFVTGLEFAMFASLVSRDGMVFSCF
jgi:hypothetical protein